jgi:4-amino-4-deoxychorismate lyase
LRLKIDEYEIMTLLVNGRFQPEMPTARRALDYGDGLFETMRYESGSVELWRYHLSRLQLGADRLGILQDVGTIETEMQQFLEYLHAQDISKGVIKLRLIRGGDQRGYAPEANSEHWRIFELFEGLPQWGMAETAMLCDHRLAIHPQLAGIKHLNRLDQVLAAKEVVEAPVSTGLMLDAQGSLRCGIDSNIYLELQDKILTPPLNNSGVAGVFRSYMIDTLCIDLDIPLVEQEIDLKQLASSSGLWLSNAVKGLRPVGSILGLAEWKEPFSPLLSKVQMTARNSLQVEP